MFVEAFIDGASRKKENQPRHAACAAVVYNKRKEVLRMARNLGDQDHNQAEYEALLLCLAMMWGSGFVNPVIYSDSAVVVNQVNGKWEVKSPKLIPLYLSVMKIKQEFDFRLEQVPRAKVFIPDELCNMTLDEEAQHNE